MGGAAAGLGQRHGGDPEDMGGVGVIQGHDGDDDAELGRSKLGMLDPFGNPSMGSKNRNPIFGSCFIFKKMGAQQKRNKPVHFQGWSGFLVAPGDLQKKSPLQTLPLAP